METKQVVPDFLQDHVPEDGKVTFDDDTDNEGEEDIDADTNAAATGNDSSGQEFKIAETNDAWGPVPAPAATNAGWGPSTTPSNDTWTTQPNTDAAPVVAW